MRAWTVRRLAPSPGDWTTVHADTAIDAAQAYHMHAGRGCWLAIDDVETEDFALIEVSGFGQVISRCFFASRAPAHAPTPAPARDLAEVARRLGVSLRLLQADWQGESGHWQPRFSH
jgi:hypothetical protein